MAVTSSQKKSNNKLNPYPGLRPFTQEEAHLFFGREGQVDNVVNSLLKNKFIAVIGSSGSGKSSLIYCGVLSKILEKGSWNVITTRPGNMPFENLNQSVNAILKKTSPLDQNPVSAKESISELLKSDFANSKKSSVIVIDQFEELFRFSSMGGDSDSIIARKDYADFIVELVNQDEFPVFIIITMRSDFIGECSRYQNFTALINKSNYLIPRMSRDNFKSVIEKPVKIFGKAIEEALVQKILEEVGDDQDQLPVLQHALMRTWNYWMENSSGEKTITISDYEKIGGIERALSDHANEAYDELNPTEKIACEKIFRSLTEKGLDNKGVRRPGKVSNLAKISESSVEQVIKIVNIFRAEGRSFLTPSISISIDEDSVIDLSHEALMRIWDRLNNWVEEEATAVGMYKRLADSAANYQVGKTSLWRPPDLQLAINWRNKNNPNLAWAERHNPAYERTIVFLNTSEEEYEREENNKIRLQKLRLRRTRVFALILGSVAIISLVMFLWTRQLSVNLEQQIVIAETERNTAEQKTIEAEQQKKIAQDNMEIAQIERLRADTAAYLAEEKRLEAVESAKIAATQTRRAELNLIRANEQSDLAIKNAQEALNQQKAAEAAREQAYQQRMLSVAKTMAVKSQAISTDKDLKALLSLQAFRFNEEYKGESFDVDIYDGLYSSLKLLLGNDYNVLKGHNNAVRSLTVLKGSNSFFTSGSDGKILKWDIDSLEYKYSTIIEGRNIIEKIAATSNGKYLLAAENRKGLFLFELNSQNLLPVEMTGLDMNIRAIAPAPDNNTVFTCGLNNIIEVWNLKEKKSEKFADTQSRINDLSVSVDGTILAGASKDGKVIYWQISDASATEIKSDSLNPVQTLEFSPDGKYLACGTIDGGIQIFNTSNNKLVANLQGHMARVTDFSFSSDNNFLVSASYDNTVMFWNLLDFTSPPIVLTDNSGFVFAAAFIGDGNYFVSGSAEDPRLIVRPSLSAIMASKVYPLINRNLSQEEWNIYVGEGIEYKKTKTRILEQKL
ncbi:MAG: hypothetical protein K9H49_13140 [Bacteroidales bacterium]|nr:hypothetical protein [Bacteroidales bacterium]MCF8390233.1 hypothetical protein [Bacteroidales bacterium]